MLSYQRGDAAAFETLYLRHKGPLYRYILRQCKNQAIAEELFQDVWMKLINARERYEVRAKFTTWIYQVANNRLIDHYRRQKTTASDLSQERETDTQELAAGLQEQPDIQSQSQEKIAHLVSLVKALPEDQRQAFLLREEAGMSIQEIADTTGVNAETAKSRLRYAVKKLRKGLEEYEPG